MEFFHSPPGAYVFSKCCQCGGISFIWNKQGWDTCSSCGPFACNMLLELRRDKLSFQTKFLRCCWCWMMDICRYNQCKRCKAMRCCRCNAFHPGLVGSLSTEKFVDGVRQYENWLQLQHRSGDERAKRDFDKPALQMHEYDDTNSKPSQILLYDSFEGHVRDVSEY